MGELSGLGSIEKIEALVLERANSMNEQFMKKLFEALSAPNHAEGQPARSMGEYICRKHKHQGWCARMYALQNYVQLAINYHHARKRFNWEESRKYMSLVCLYGEMKAEARVRFYGTQCDCPGLDLNAEFQTIKPY